MRHPVRLHLRRRIALREPLFVELRSHRCPTAAAVALTRLLEKLEAAGAVATLASDYGRRN